MQFKKAQKLTNIFKTLHVICSCEWLLFGIGQPPQLCQSLTKLNNSQIKAEEVTYWDDEIAAQQEINFFLKANRNAIVLLVNDKSMEPYFNVGDYVGGKKRFVENINSIVGMDCIVQLKNKIQLIRHVKNCNKPDVFNLYCKSWDASIINPALYEVELNFAAPIIWHRKKDEKVP